MTDWELIQRFAGTRDETAFEAIVERHGGIVFSSARRQVGPDAAADVTQAVFLVLARKASTLRKDVVLSSWLFRTTGFVVAQWRRQEARRLRRETWVAMNSTESTPPEVHDESSQLLRRHLDDAISALKESDRQYLLVRFFERRKFAELAERFGVSEEAAKKRVARALERMRSFLAARGVAVSSVALATMIMENRVEALPSGWSADLAHRAVLRISRSVAENTSTELESAGLHGWKRRSLGRAVELAGCGLLLVVGITGFVQYLARDGRTGAPPDISSVAFARDSVVDAMRARAAAARDQKRMGSGLDLIVLDASSKAPLATASVREKRLVAPGHSARAEVVHTVDAEGRCWIPVEDRNFERLELVVSAPGKIAAELRWLPHEFGVEGLRYVCGMFPGISIAGEVHDLNDLPVPGAVVRFRSTSMYPIEGRARPMCELETVSDAHGHFVFEQVPPVEFESWNSADATGGTGRRRTIQVRHPHYARKTFELPFNVEWTRPLILQLAPGTTLYGMVTALSGEPVAGAVVSEEFRDEVYGFDLAWNSRADSDGATRRGISAITDAHGRFELPHFTYPDETGSTDFLVEGAGFEPYRCTVIGEEAGFPASNLFDTEGRPKNRPAKSSSILHGFHRAMLDEKPSSDGARRLRVSVELEPRPTLDARTAEPPVAEAPLRLGGRAVDGDTGAPIPAYRVFGRMAGTSYTRFLGEGRDGEFEWDLGADWRAAVQFEVQAEGYLPAKPERREEFPGGLRLEFKLRNAADIWGWVELPNTQPAVGAWVTALPAGVSSRWNMAGELNYTEDQELGVRVGRDGRFRLRPGSGARFLRVLHPEGYALRSVAAGNDTVLRLEPWASVHGVLTENDHPLPGTTVRLISDPASPMPFELVADSDASGRFRFERVPGGALRVLAENASASVQVKGGQSVSVALRR
ncbi:MAG: sigma-70 family RNA polymerase sigma factor [Verrucomicrobiales bacterium]|nr:sigma-70 family RNA polymerase sigma factor [Verrucomicrobiales bacterium]